MKKTFLLIGCAVLVTGCISNAPSSPAPVTETAVVTPPAPPVNQPKLTALPADSATLPSPDYPEYSNIIRSKNSQPVCKPASKVKSSAKSKAKAKTKTVVKKPAKTVVKAAAKPKKKPVSKVVVKKPSKKAKSVQKTKPVAKKHLRTVHGIKS